MIRFFCFLLFSGAANAFGLGADTLQLDRLIEKSQQQIYELKKIVEYKKKDAESLTKAVQILDTMLAGIGDSIAQYKGTEAYEKALLELQSKNDFAVTYADPKKIHEAAKEADKNSDKDLDRAFADLVRFQEQSVQANQDDFKRQQNLQQALGSAKEGFVPKIQAQAELGSWQASTRVSAQLTALLSSLQATREELRLMRLREQQNDTPLSSLIEGAETQNRIQREGKLNASR